MKKIFPLLFSFILMTNIAFATGIKVFLNNNQIDLSGEAIMEKGRVLVPMRSIFETLGATVNWNAANNLVTASKGNIKIALQIGNKNMGYNGKLIPLDVAPKLVAGRTLIPIRVISESFGYKVNWDNSVYIVGDGNIDNATHLPGNDSGQGVVTIDDFSWVSPKLPMSDVWEENLNKRITITSSKISFIQCEDEIEFRNKIFTGSGWSRTIPRGTTLTLIRIGRMYPDTLYVKLDDGTKGILYVAND